MATQDRATMRNTMRKVILITEVNTANNYIEGVDNLRMPYRVTWASHGPVVVVPNINEQWIIQRTDNTWGLVSRYEDGTESLTTDQMFPGDKRLEASGTLYLRSASQSIEVDTVTLALKSSLISLPEDTLLAWGEISGGTETSVVDHEVNLYRQTDQVLATDAAIRFKQFDDTPTNPDPGSMLFYANDAGQLVSHNSDGVIVPIEPPAEAATPTLTAGFVAMFGGKVLPTGWLWCDGSEVLKSSYPDLWASFGSTHIYGTSSDPTNKFKLPDLRNRFVYGSNDLTGFTDYNTQGGASTVTLTTTQMPSHTHTSAAHTHTSAAHTHTTPNHTHTMQSAGSHSHTVIVGGTTVHAGSSGSLYGFGDGFANSSSGTVTTDSQGSHTHTVDSGGGSTSGSTTPGDTGSTTPGPTGSAGGDGSHTNMPPYLVMGYAIRASNGT